MSVQAEAERHQRQRALTAAAAATAAGALWRQTDTGQLRASWVALLTRAVAVTTAGQLTAAQQAEPFLAAVLGTDADRAQSDQLRPDMLAGVAGDGRPLPELLMFPLYTTLSALARGASLALAWASGAALLDLLVRTVVADAGRAADLTVMATRPAVTSYVRVVELPACARCIVLAGREYSLSDGFARHPRCDCTMAPVTRTSRPTPVDAKDVFTSMTEAQRLKAFGSKAVEAIEAGADVAQVVNARRGMREASLYGRTVQATTEGTTRRGLAARQRSSFERKPGGRYATARAVRLMPEEIMRRAKDREHAVRLLRLHGYLY
ncbi:hypothetical protein ACTVZO_17755 [Streptomyces sp. IBSNAI002]|uniref:hypothetical protein n=1 Tax=Streptomyces sp. IBSNAI002 TaxID=3457500 RepID=UPI003FD16469